MHDARVGRVTYRRGVTHDGHVKRGWDVVLPGGRAARSGAGGAPSAVTNCYTIVVAPTVRKRMMPLDIASMAHRLDEIPAQNTIAPPAQGHWALVDRD